MDNHNDIQYLGMAQPGRNWNDANGDYRYGYNGKEEDNEIKANSTENGKSLDYGARWYDPRKARWDATDAFEAKYPSFSPYNYVANSPLMFIDPDGNVVEATTEEAQKYVVNSVESAYRDFVTFDKKGILDVQKLSDGIKEMSKLTEVPVNSNVATLLRMAENELVVAVDAVNSFEVTHVDGTKSKITFFSDQTNLGERTAGVTIPPKAEENLKLGNIKESLKRYGITADGKIHIYVNNSVNRFGHPSSGESFGVTTAHELYGHAYFYMLREYFIKSGDLEKANLYYPWHIMKGKGVNERDTNKLLNNQIDRAENQAKF